MVDSSVWSLRVAARAGQLPVQLGAGRNAAALAALAAASTAGALVESAAASAPARVAPALAVVVIVVLVRAGLLRGELVDEFADRVLVDLAVVVDVLAQVDLVGDVLRVV